MIYLRFAVQRLAAQWRGLLMVIIGVLLAAVIGANGTLYTAAVSQIGMIERLERQSPQTNQIFTRISLKGKDQGDLIPFWEDLDSGVKREAQATFTIPGWYQNTVTGIETQAVNVFIDGQPVTSGRLRPVYYEGWTEQVEVVEGSLPAGSPSDVDFEAVVSAPVAALIGLKTGDIVSLEEQGWETSLPATVRISGIVRPLDADALYWTAPDPLRIDVSATGDSDANLLVSREAAARFAVTHVPDSNLRLIWRGYFDHRGLAFNQVPLAINQLETFEEKVKPVLEPPDLPRRSFVFELGIVPVLESYQQEVAMISAPFNLLLIQIGALVLLFLSVIIALVRRGERREIALLQSRGAAGYQIMLLRGLEALMICVAAGLAAPFIARALLVALAPVILNIERLSLEITGDAFTYSLGAALAAFVVMVVTLYPVLRQPLITAGGSTTRGATQAWWQRYYLDLVVMVVGFIGLWRLLNSSSLLVGSDRTDPLLILAPALLFVALGSILLRVFPGMVAVFARIVSTQRGLGRVLAGWQVSREPAHYARITLLLALAVGIGWFASSFLATFERSQIDRARFEVGADIRISEGENPRPLDEYRAMSGVESAAQVARFTEVPVGINTVSFDTGDLLAVDFESLREAAYWRSDLGELKAPGETFDIPQVGEALPFTPHKIGLWVYPRQVQSIFNQGSVENPAPVPYLATMTTIANLRAPDGRAIPVVLEPVAAEGIDDLAALFEEHGDMMMNFRPEFLPDGAENPFENMTGWLYLEGEIDPAFLETGGIRLETISFSNFGFGFGSEPQWKVFVGDPLLYDAGGSTTPVTFENDWGVIQDGTPPTPPLIERRELAQVEGSSQPTQTGLYAEWQETQQNTRIMMTLNFSELSSIPALVTPSFVRLNNLDQGLDFRLYLNQNPVNLTVLDTIDFYPTLYGSERPFIIVDANRMRAAEQNGIGTYNMKWETWLKLAPGTDETAFVQMLAATGSVITVSERLKTYEADPLSVGLIGLLFLSFLIVLVLSIISLLTYSILTAQARRIEFGVLQALGVAPSRLVASVAIEQGVILTIAVMLGAVLGAVLSSQVIPALSSSSSTSSGLPFVVQFEADALAQYGLLMAVVLSAVLVVSLLLVRRLSLAQALRLGEE